MHTGMFCPNCLLPAEEQQESCRACRYKRPPSGWPRDEYLGRTINRKYRIISRLGEGGFGVVVRARHVQRGVDLGDVVLKFMHPHLASRYSLRRRFVNEARAARALNDPHVVKVFDLDFDERGVPYLVMEYLEGQLLGTLLKHGPLDPARALRLGIQIAGALDVCHGAGIVHRDLKPSNILLLPDRHQDFVKLIDFGIAHLPDTSLSETMLGTPKYMPPEQIRREPLDEGVDIFALGVLLFECLAGEPPIVGRGPEYLFLNLDQAPRRLRELAPGLPEELEGLLAKMMAKERAARPASMADVEARLTAIGSAQTWVTAASVRAMKSGVLSLIDMTPTRAPADSASDRPAAMITVRRPARLVLWAAGLLLATGAGVAAYLGLTAAPPTSPGATAPPSTRAARGRTLAPDLRGARASAAAAAAPDRSAAAREGGTVVLLPSSPDAAVTHAVASPAAKRSHRPAGAVRPARPEARDVKVQVTDPDTDGFEKVPGL